jgi:hypothetical protein
MTLPTLCNEEPACIPAAKEQLPTGKSYLLSSCITNKEGSIMNISNILCILLISMLCILAVDAASLAPFHIGHGLIGNQDPHETGAAVLGSYFDPNQGTYDNYWSYEYRIFDYWRLKSSRIQWSHPARRYHPAHGL